MIPSIYVILTAMTPVGELRAAIPLGIQQFDLSWSQALLLSLLGNTIPIPVLLWTLPRLSSFLLSFPNPLGSFIAWRAERLRTSQGQRFKKYGAVALLPFVAVPLPLTGAWTGCLLAWALDISPRKALPVIWLGVLLAGIIVVVLTLGGIKLAGLLS